MTEFKAGDKVRVVASGSTSTQWVGVEGIVVRKANSYGSTYVVELTTSPKGEEHRYPKGREAWLIGLELIEEPAFTYADIQKGDTIRRTKTYADGSVDTREGVAGIQSGYYWANAAESLILAYDFDDNKPEVTLELLDRPEPEPKKPWEDATPGTVFKRITSNGSSSLFILQDNGEWLIRYGTGGTHKPLAGIGDYIVESDTIEVLS